MTTLPVAEGARLLGIHPKTLHHWLTQAGVPWSAHPTDARRKCVAEEHLLEVARRHGRSLPPLAAAARLSEAARPPSREEPAKRLAAHEADPAHRAVSLSAPSALEADLLQRLSHLETKISTLQQHLAHLALALLQERERTVEQRLAALEALIQPAAEKPLPAEPHEQGARQEPGSVSPRVYQPLAVEQRARPALIEYGAQGAYVIISSQEGELHLTPDSAEWFAWLASISSFRFVGQQGRFTAYRHARLSRSWRAHRRLHQQDYKQLLGKTDQLTIQRLEQVAAALQAHLSSL